MPYYAVARGVKTGIYKDWNTCSRYVTGFKGAVFKKFPTLSSAQQFIRSRSSSSISSTAVENSDTEVTKTLKAEREEEPSDRILVSSNNDSQLKNLVREPPTLKVAVNNFLKNPSFYWSGDTKPSAGDIIVKRIYVDGASRGNGKIKWPSSGYGVFYGLDDDRNAAVALDTVDDPSQLKPTNQRAELLAIKHALINIANDIKQVTEGDASITTKYSIYSDSKYSISCLTDWIVSWYKNGWKNSQGSIIANKDIIGATFPILNYVNHIYNSNNLGDLQFHHVRGHRGDFGNEWADKLANIGADDMSTRVR